MEGKFTTWEKWVELCGFLILVLSGIYKGVCGGGDAGILITLLFVAVLVFVVLSVAALFPATWRMTDKQKEKLKDIGRYQENYTKVFVIINFVLCVIMGFFILIVT